MGFFWFHLFSSLENTEDMTPYTLVELGLRSHVKLGRNLYHNYSSQRGREMKNASFFYLVSSEIMDINPVPRWMRGFLFFFFTVSTTSWLTTLLLASQIYLFGERWRLDSCRHISYTCSPMTLIALCFFSTHNFPIAFTHHCKNNKPQD